MTNLAGIQILDFTPYLPGHFCSQILADLGAEVIKVERPGTGNDVRQTRPGIFWTSNRNKRSLTVNLKHPEGKRILLDLAAQADVVLEAFAPGTMDKLGLGCAQLRGVKPDLIYCSISGFGQDGPRRDLPGFDITYLALSGALSLPGTVDQPPSRPALPMGDLSSGMFAAIGIISALFRRQSTGQGQYLDVAMTEALVSLTSVRMGEYLLEGRVPAFAELSYLSPANTVFACADGERLAVGALEDRFWQRLCTAVGRHDWVNEPRFARNEGRLQHAGEILPVLKEAFATRSRDQWLQELEAAGVPCAPVYGPPEVFADPQVQARDLAPDVGGGRRQVRLPIRFDGQAAPVSLVPEVGEHNEAILGRLGYGPADLGRLKADGVV